MNRLLLITFMLCVITSATYAQSQSDPLADTLFALERAWADAELAGDTLSMRQILADDFVATTFYGATISDKEIAVGAVLDPDLTLASIEQHDLEMRRLDESVAFVTGRAVMDWSYKGVRLPHELRYLRIYERIDGRWQVVAAHVSPIYDPLAPDQE